MGEGRGMGQDEGGEGEKGEGVSEVGRMGVNEKRRDRNREEQRKARRHRKVTFATSVAESESAVARNMEIMIYMACSAH